MQATITPPRTRNFANPECVVQSWYIAAPSRAVKPDRSLTVPMFDRRVTLYRDPNGSAHAVDARCPHLGANLGHGAVVDGELQCAFHGWRFDVDGFCTHAPGLDLPPRRRLRVYPTTERFGLVWLFNGTTPLFDLPAPPDKTFRAVRLPSQEVGCHPHLVIANGLDATHFEELHGMVCTEPPELRVEPPYRVSLRLRGKPKSALLRHLTATHTAGIDATFTTIGGNLAWVELRQPTRLYVLFSGKPTPDGHCRTGTVFFLPKHLRLKTAQAILSLVLMLRDDRRVLDDIDFRPAFVDADTALRAFARVVDDMPVW